MVKRILVACLAFAALSAQALPVTFTSWQLGTDTVAVSDGTPDLQGATGSTDLITSSAASIGLDVATAGAIAGPGLLSTSADVTGLGSFPSSAVGTAHVVGSFTGSGAGLIGIDFTSSSFGGGSGGGATSLFVTLTSGGTTVFSDFLGASRTFSFSLSPGGTGTLELTLSSEANAGFLAAQAGSFSTSGLVNITTPVPEPETLLMLVVGLGAIGAVMRRRALPR